MSKYTETTQGEQVLDEGTNQEGGNSTSSTDVKDRPTASGAQNIMTLIVIVLLVAGGLYYVFGSSDTNKKKPTDNQIPITGNRPQTAGDVPVPELYSSGAPSGEIVLEPTKKHSDVKKKAEVAPPPPPSPAAHEITHVFTPSPPSQAVQNNKLAQQQARMKANIMLTDGGGGAQASGSASTKRELNSNFKPVVTSASNTKVTKVGNLSYLITQCKIMEGVLETPINTNYPGPVRAVLSRDVYSEKGENVLIPKGSRLIGSFAQGVQAGHARVAVQWKRIIMPNGYDINISSAPGVDSLGQVGVDGDIHREFLGIIGNAVLLSLMNITMAHEVQKHYNIQSSQSQTTTNTDGSTSSTSNSNPTQQAAEQEVKRLGSVTEQWFKDNFQAKPFVTISQGTVVKIFVNQDIQFPSNIFSGVNHLG